MKLALKTVIIVMCTIIALPYVIIAVFIVVSKLFPNRFHGLGIDLPLPTRVVMGLSDFVGNYWWVIFVFLLMLILLSKRSQD